MMTNPDVNYRLAYERHDRNGVVTYPTSRAGSSARWVLRHESGVLVRAFRWDYDRSTCIAKSAQLMREFASRCGQRSTLRVRRLDGTLSPMRAYYPGHNPTPQAVEVEVES